MSHTKALDKHASESSPIDESTAQQSDMDTLIDDIVGDGGNAEQKQEEVPAPPPKKRPGRPKKRVVTEAIKISGVVDTPNDPEDKVEMVYQNPAMFKSIFALLKAYAAKELMMYFKKDP